MMEILEPFKIIESTHKYKGRYLDYSHNTTNVLYYEDFKNNKNI